MVTFPHYSTHRTTLSRFLSKKLWNNMKDLGKIQSKRIVALIDRSAYEIRFLLIKVAYGTSIFVAISL